MSAALVLGRARRKTLLVDEGEQSNRVAHHVGGLLALDGTPPAEIYERGRSQLGAYDAVEVRDTGAVSARQDGDGFTVELEGGHEVSARTLVLAMGMDYEVPDIPGFRELWGDAVFHCPFCHGWEVRDKRVVVCGDEESAGHQSALLGGCCNDISTIDPADVSHLRIEDGELRAVVGADGTEMPCDAVAVHTPLKQRSALAEKLGVNLTEDGYIETDAMMQTSLPGVFAAGDVSVAPQQVAIAMGSGHLAGIMATKELLVGRD